MNSRLFNKLMKEVTIKYHPPEWKTFLEFCDLYLKQKKIKNPTVLDLESWEGKDLPERYKFYEQLFEAVFTNINKRVDILSIPGGRYEIVKRNFENYSPRCTSIIAFHGIETYRDRTNKATKTWKFWDELKLKAYKGAEEYRDFLFLTIFNRRSGKYQMGIGVMIRK